MCFFFFSSRRRHTRYWRDWSSDVCSSDLDVELRPRSYLVTPTLDRARQALLTEFNVVWVPMTGEEFTQQILDQVRSAARQGLEKISVLGASTKSEAPALPEVARLATNPMQGTEFLVGQEPIWADL